MIRNAEAGSADEAVLDRALAVLRAGTSVEVAATSDPGELNGVLHRAASRRIVVAGGDGSMHAVVDALHRRHDLQGRVLGLLPLGTGNDFARGRGLPLDPEEAARVVLEGEPTPTDLILDEVGEVVVNHVHVGAGAEAGRRAALWKDRLGAVGVPGFNLKRLGYPVGAALTALDPPAIRVRVEVDGEVLADLDRPVLMVAVGNAPTVGGGTALVPDADPGDGVLDVMISHAVGPIARVGYAARLALRRHPERDDVVVRRGRQVTVAGEEFWCSADGEIYGPERHRTWRVESDAYRMLLPR